MEDETYYDHSVTLRIYSEEDLNFNEIELALKLVATDTHKKGDRRGSSSPKYKHDMWCYESGVSTSEPLENRLYALWRVLKQNKAYLLGLKKVAIVDIFCGYRSNSHTAGIEVAYQSLEIFRELEIDFSLSIITT